MFDEDFHSIEVLERLALALEPRRTSPLSGRAHSEVFQTFINWKVIFKRSPDIPRPRSLRARADAVFAECALCKFAHCRIRTQ